MLHLITLLCMLLSLNNSDVTLAADPVFISQIYLEAQAAGSQAAADKLCQELPDILAEAGIEITEYLPIEPGKETSAESENPEEELPDEPEEALPEAQQIDIDKLDYKEELKKLGFNKEESADAKLNLRNAVLRFQSSCNLTVNGIWDDKCLQCLAEHIKSEGPVNEDLVETSPTEGKWITVNKTRRILTLYENDRVLQKYPVAIGNPTALTPDGKFKVVSKVVNPAWGGGGYAKPVKGGVPQNPLGYRWLGLSYKDGDTLGIHGNNSPYSIGKNISHGCIRMINSDVEQLFTIVPRSAPVWIGTDAKLREWGVIQKTPE